MKIKIQAKLTEEQHEAFLLLPGGTEEGRILQAIGVAFDVAQQQAVERNKQLTIADEIRIATASAHAAHPGAKIITREEAIAQYPNTEQPSE